jgi:hypothetical protein
MTRVVDPYPDDTINSLRAEVDRLRAALERIQNTASPDIVWSWYRDVARAALGGDT